MAFYNWNFQPPAPIFPLFTYIIQPAFPSISVTDAPTPEESPIDHEVPKIKQEPSYCEIKDEIDVDDDCLQVPIKQEPIEEAIKQEPIEEKPQKSPRRNFICASCPYTTTWKGNLTKHVVSRHTALDDIKWLQCDHCSYKGKTKDYLKCHLLHLHNISVKWFDCPHCSFKAKVKSHFDRHIMVNHTDSDQIDWFACEHCSYRAKFKNNLKEHVLNKHTEIEWHNCDVCEFKAKRKRNLKFHQLNKHTEDDQIDWIKCEFCPARCRKKAAMTVHVKSVHTKKLKITVKTKEIPVFIDNKLCWRRVVVDDDDPYNYCKQCNFKTPDKDVFKKHILKEHVVTEFKQQDDCIVKTSYKTKDVIVIVDDVPCVKRVVVS